MKSLIQNLPPKIAFVYMITQKTTTVLKRMKHNQIIFSVQRECSLHVTIIHRHAILEYDGLDSTEIITEHFFVIFPDLQHDHNFTKCAQQHKSIQI
jgi:hypothetical protein